MVSYSDVILNNESLLPSSPPDSGPVAVFTGCTQGIGLATLRALLKHTAAPTCYLIGRSAARLDTIIGEGKDLNPSARLYAIIVSDLALVRDAQRAADLILHPANPETQPKPERVDLLFMSAGWLSFSSRPDYSRSEGLDRITAVRYHARMALVVALLPLLRAASSPRVLSVMAAGQEGALRLDDLGMTDAGRYGAVYAAGAAASMTTLALEHLASLPGNEKLVFVHLYPGFVAGTGLTVRDGPVVLRFLFNRVLRPMAPLLALFPWGGFAYTSAEVGERVLFAATNGRFRRLADPASGTGTLVQQGSDGVVGSGVYTVRADSGVYENGGTKALKKLRHDGAAKRVWEYTLAEFERIGRTA